MKKDYNVKDIIKAECNLSPVKCVKCGSREVSYHQYVNDAYCAECGYWQNNEKG